MVRFYYVIIASFFLILYYVPKMAYYAKHPEKYTETQCYKLAMKVMELVKRKGRITTKAFGTEKLPKEGGYIMYANHQGKYDTLGIMTAHKEPCSIVIDSKTAKQFIVNQAVDLVKGKRFVRGDIRQQAGEIVHIIKEVKAGRRYIVFPEAGYVDNKNELIEFHAGSFKMALKAQCPIVPVVLWDSWKAFYGKSLKPVKNQVHFLEPIAFEDYKEMNTQEICELVKSKIQNKLDELRIAAEDAKENEEADRLAKSRFLGIYDWTVLLTYVSLCFGILGSCMAISGRLANAMECLVLTALFEKLNEKFERAKFAKCDAEEHRYGTHADSLTNLICFGVLPCAIGYAVGLCSIIHMVFYTFYIISVVVRLAYFNAKKESAEDSSKKYHIGLSVLSIAVLLPVLYLFKDALGSIYQLIMTCIYPIAGISYISSFRIRKIKVLEDSEEITSADNDDIEAGDGVRQ